MPRTFTPRVQLVCEHCSTPFSRPPSLAAQGDRFCSRACASAASRQGATITCMGCGVAVAVRPSQVGVRKYCTSACQREYQKPRITCIVCGTERKTKAKVIEQGARFCSWDCARMALNKPRPTVTCEQCGTVCAVPPSRIKQGMRFCSHSCRSIWNITHGAMASPTSIEVILYRVLDQLGVAYIPQYPMPEAATVPDAYVPTRRLVLYADGAYWHSLPKTAERDSRQNQRLAELGYTVRRLAEADLRHDPIGTIERALA